MVYFPKLSPEAVNLLRIIATKSGIPGSVLQRAAGAKMPGALVAPIQELQKENLIRVGGDASQETSLPFATFGVLPSAKEYISTLLEQQR